MGTKTKNKMKIMINMNRTRKNPSKDDAVDFLITAHEEETTIQRQVGWPAGWRQSGGFFVRDKIDRSCQSPGLSWVI